MAILLRHSTRFHFKLLPPAASTGKFLAIGFSVQASLGALALFLRFFPLLLVWRRFL